MGNHPYDSTNYTPPAPVCNIKIFANLAKTIDIDEDPFKEVKTLVDTGADMCIIPKSIVIDLEKELGAELPYDLIEVEDFNGQTSPHKVYKLIAHIRNSEESEHILDFLEVDNSGEGILGRELLNKFTITLNAPNHWTLG